MSEPTDKELLDYLQKLTDESKYTGWVVLQQSTTGRGWRLHESDMQPGYGHASLSVRHAIAMEMAIAAVKEKT